MKTYRDVSYQDVDIDRGFWHDRQALNRDVTIFSVLDRFRETGRFDAFRCDWREGQPNKPHIFWDSDVAKWMESAAYLLAKAPNPRLEEAVEGVIDQIERNQEPDGYFDSYFIAVQPSARHTCRDWHELYCAGHLIEAAVAYDQATGRDRFLRLMERYVELIDRVFRVEDSAAFATPGHEEIELALVKLYRHTGKRQYLTLAEWFVDRRGANEKDKAERPKPLTIQSHMPCKEQRTAEGHAVRAGYLYSAMADIALERGDEELQAACKAIFESIAYRRMYVTGGLGSSRYGEAFTIDYDLQNEIAYTETCASIALIFFAQRMLHIAPDSLYADVAETALYNGFLSGVSLDGKSFFYTNPMEIDVSHHGRNVSVEEDAEWLPIMERVEVFNCSCCPPNVTRLFASLGEFLYTHGEGRVYVHQYTNNTARFQTEAGGVTLRQETRYPEDGAIRLTATGMKGQKLCLRIPGWCEEFALDAPYQMERGYAVIDVDAEEAAYSLSLTMKPTLLEANPLTHADAGRAAVRRGPIVYCAETLDNAGSPQTLLIDAESDFELVKSDWHALPDILADGWRAESPKGDWLYRKLQSPLVPVKLRLIPYFAIANRGATDMQVWLLLRRA